MASRACRGCPQRARGRHLTVRLLGDAHLFERHQFDYVRLFANLLDIVPVGSETERQVVLKTVAYFEDGMTPFDAFHAATAETRGFSVLSSDKAYDDVDPERLPLEPTSEE